MCSSALPAPGSSLTLRVSFVEVHPTAPVVKLWGLPLERRGEYLRLAEELQARPGPRLAASRLLSPYDLCLVELDGRWHRGRVVGGGTTTGTTTTTPDDTAAALPSYRVFLLDEGRTVSAGPSHLARGAPELFQLPSEVMGCFLADLVPPPPPPPAAGTGKPPPPPPPPHPLGSGWPPGALDFLAYLQGTQVTGLVREVLTLQHLVILELPGLVAQMQQQGLAGPPVTRHAFSLLLHSYLGCITAAAAPPPPLPPKHQLPTCSFPREAPPPPRLSSPGGAPQEYFYPKLNLNVTETVLVTQVSDPYRVYCQLRSFSKEIQLLSNAMYQSFEAFGGKGLEEFLPLPGAPCAAQGKEGGWYRALLLEVVLEGGGGGGGPEEQQPGAMARVICVDNGKREFVSKKNLRQLPLECFRMPVMTYPCSLQGITDGGAGWTQPQISQLKSLLLGKVLQARIETYCPFEHLYYVTLYGENGLNFNYLYGVQAHCLVQSLLHSDQGYNSVTEQESVVAPGKKEPRSPQSVLPVLAASPLPIVRLKAGECYSAQVSFLQDPCKFWVNLQEHRQPLYLLKRNLRDFYSQSKKLEGIPLVPRPGSLCCVMLKENSFHRALVLKVQGKDIEVYFMDKGSTETVDLYKAKGLLPHFRALPAVALRCALANPSPSQLWNPDAVEYFKKAVLNKDLEIRVQGVQGETYIVEVYDHSLPGEKNLGKIMSQGRYNNCHEDETQVTSQRTKNEPFKRRPEGEGSLQQFNKDICCMSRKAIAEKDCRISSGFVSDYSRTKPGFYCHEQLEVGSTVDVVVSCTESPSLFWCRLANHSGALRALMGKLQDHCAHALQPHGWSSPVCLAKYSGDNCWYRALIVSKASCAEEVEVVYVDYGNKEWVSFKDICATKAEFLQLKAQAFRCSLYNLIQPNGQDPFVWDEEATEAFQEFVDSASRMELMCTIFASAALNNSETFSIVDLMTPTESACQFLKRKGLARPVQPEKSLIPSVHLLSYYYSAHHLKIGSEEMVYVTHVNDPSFFYCQLANSTAVLTQLSSIIDKLSKTWHRLQKPQPPGNVYLARYSDGLWYRAVVTAAKATKEVFFVDFGNTELLKNEDLIEVPNDAYDLLRLPMLAIKCCLSDVPNVRKDAAEWFEKVVVDKTLKALIVGKEPDGSWIIELYDGKMQINAKLREDVGLKKSKVISEYAENEVSVFRYPLRREADTETKPILTDIVKRIPYSKKSCIESQETIGNSKHNSSWREEKLAQQKTERVMTRRCAQLIDRSKPVEGKKGRVFLKGTIQNKEGKINENLKQSKTNTLFVSKNICDLPQKNIKPGLKTLVYVSHINNPSDFYVQLVEDEHLLDSISEKLNSSKTLESLKGQKLHLGELMCALFADDGLWYRAVVIEEPSGELATVQYIDYGNISVVDISKTSQLLEDCSSFPAMSMHCSLHGIKTIGPPEWTEERVLCFYQRTHEVQLNCEFVENMEGKWEILLCDTKGNIAVDLGQKPLVDTGEGEATNGEVALINLDEVASAKNEKSANMSDVTFFQWTIPKVGQTVKNFSVTAKSPGYFWCQFSNRHDLYSVERKLQEAGELEGIVMSDIVSGYPCLAKSSESGTFYRAIISDREENMLAVIHVDYGTEELIGVEMIRKIPDQLLAVPPQAFLCSLFGLNTEEDSETEEINKIFCDMVAGCPVEITVMDKKDHCLLTVPVFVVKLEYQKVTIKEQIDSIWKYSPENGVSAISSICSPEKENSDGQGKHSEDAVFETEPSVCLLASAEDTGFSDLLPCSMPLQPMDCSSVDTEKRRKEAFCVTPHTYKMRRHQVTLEAFDTEDQHSVFESLDGEADHYVPEKRNGLCLIDAAEMQCSVSSQMEVSDHDNFENQDNTESEVEILVQEKHFLLDDTTNMSDLGFLLTDDSKQMELEPEELRMHSSKDTLELETTEKSFFSDELQEKSELVLFEGLHVEKELQQSPSLRDKADGLFMELVSHEVDKAEEAITLLDLSAACPHVDSEGQPPLAEPGLQNFSCAEGPTKVSEAVLSVSKINSVEWQSLLEKRSDESCDLCETHNGSSFVGEKSLSDTQLNEEHVNSSSHDTGNRMNILKSLLRSGLETGEEKMTDGSDPPCGNLTESTAE